MPVGLFCRIAVVQKRQCPCSTKLWGAFPSGPLVLGQSSGSCLVRWWMAWLVEANS
jgi:hypothetical protein